MSTGRSVKWLLYDPSGYGLIEVSKAKPRGRLVCVYFARASDPKPSKRWELFATTPGTPDEELQVDLFSMRCTCPDFGATKDCDHLRALSCLEHHGRL